MNTDRQTYWTCIHTDHAHIHTTIHTYIHTDYDSVVHILHIHTLEGRQELHVPVHAYIHVHTYIRSQVTEQSVRDWMYLCMYTYIPIYIHTLTGDGAVREELLGCISCKNSHSQPNKPNVKRRNLMAHVSQGLHKADTEKLLLTGSQVCSEAKRSFLILRACSKATCTRAWRSHVCVYLITYPSRWTYKNWCIRVWRLL